MTNAKNVLLFQVKETIYPIEKNRIYCKKEKFMFADATDSKLLIFVITVKIHLMVTVVDMARTVF